MAGANSGGHAGDVALAGSSGGGAPSAGSGGAALGGGGSASAGSAGTSAGSAGENQAGSGAAGAPSGPLTDVAYVPDPDSVFANPERGFYHHRETTAGSYSALDGGDLSGFRSSESISLALRVFYLETFVSQDISASYLTKVSQDFATARSSGVKLVLRFAYTADGSGNDAALAQVLAHIAQLAPVLQANADVIATVQAGLIGAWGEWYYTQHFGNAGNVSAVDYQNRKAVVDALLGALPASRTVLVRTPDFKRKLYGDAALSAATAFGSSPAARVGHHNDAFVADASDMGTYSNPEVELPYLEADTAFVPIGGENDQYQAPRSACPSALADMERFHWSFINTDYLAETIDQWKSQGCFASMQRRLGYRLALVSGSFSQKAALGGSIQVALTLENSGFAAPFNPRQVELVLRPVAGGALHRLPLTSDPRTWLPGKAIELQQTVALAAIPAGKYDLLLALPDPTPSLHDDAKYAIRLANAGVWDAATGSNALGAQLEVSAN
jgi:hypothetical protein